MRAVAGLRSGLTSSRLLSLGFYGFLLALWESASAGGIFPSYLLPAPTSVLKATIDRFPILIANAGVTVCEVLMGFTIGSLLGFALGLAITYSRVIAQVLYPAVILTQAIPKLAIAPLFIVWFGVGIEPKVAIAALMCLFPVLINTVVAMQGVDSRLIQLLDSISASEWQIFRMVRLPAGLPVIFGGLRVAVTLAVVGALVAEWLGSDAGLGYLVLLANSQLRTDDLYASLLAVSLLAIILMWAVERVERLVLPHQGHTRRELAMESVMTSANPRGNGGVT